MPLCSECGGQFPSEARYCPHCGVEVTDNVSSPSSAPYASGQHPPSQQSNYTAASQSDARTFAMLCHLASFSGFLIPMGNIIGPLAVWLFKRFESPFIDHHGKEAINFQISLTLYLIASAILIIVLVGILLLITVGLAGIVFTVIAAMRASEGKEYRYPMTIRFIK